MSPAERQLVQLIQAAFPLEGGLSGAPTRLEGADEFLDQAIACSKQHGLSCLLYAALTADASAASAGRADAARGAARETFGRSAAALVELQELYRSSALACRLAHHALAELLDAFAARELPALVLKGAALSVWLYPSPELRPFGDLDLLVRREDAARAFKLLEQVGFVPAPDFSPGFSPTLRPEFSYTRRTHAGTTVDLHWHLLLPTYYQRHIPGDWFWQHRMALSNARVALVTLDPLAQLIHLSAHAVLHHPEPRLVLYYDLARLCAQETTRLDWAAVVSTARQFRLSQIVALALRRAAAWWNAPVPPHILDALERPKTEWEGRVVFALTTAPHAQARALSDGLYQPTFRGKAAFLFRFLFPSREYMRGRYGCTRAICLPWYYLVRLLASFGLVARSLYSSATTGRAE